MVDVIDKLKIHDSISLVRKVDYLTIRSANLGFTPRVTVVVPTYKRVKTLKDTIDSINNQIGFNDIHIIISDNSAERNDETEVYISSLADERITYIKNLENLGMTGNWNRLFDMSKTEYTVIVHDDDILLLHFLEITLSIMQSHPEVDILAPKFIPWKDGFEDRPCENLKPKAKLTRLTEYDCMLWNPFPPTGMIVRTKTIIELGGYDPSVYPSIDYYFNVKAINNVGVYSLSQPLYIYRWGINATLKLETMLGFIEMDIPLKQELISRHRVSRLFKSLLYISFTKYIIKIKDVYPEYPTKDIPTVKAHHLNPVQKLVEKPFFKLWNRYMLHKQKQYTSFIDIHQKQS